MKKKNKKILISFYKCLSAPLLPLSAGLGTFLLYFMVTEDFLIALFMGNYVSSLVTMLLVAKGFYDDIGLSYKPKK